MIVLSREDVSRFLEATGKIAPEAAPLAVEHAADLRDLLRRALADERFTIAISEFSI